MEDRTIGVRGDRIHWARTQQGITMRWIKDHGGPSLGYQSEVEHGKKSEVRSELLFAWARLLNVTEPFLRGQLSRYDERPGSCRGLAGNTGLILMGRRPDWAHMGPMERTQEVLRLTALESPQLPRVVLAYVLGLELNTLDEMMIGKLPLVKNLVLKLADLTALPMQFFMTGQVSVEDDYLEAIREAKAAGLSPDDLCRLIVHRNPLV